MALDSMEEIFEKIRTEQKPFWQVVRDTDVEERQVTAEASFRKMRSAWRAMLESVDGPTARTPERQRPGGRRRPEDVGLRRWGGDPLRPLSPGGHRHGAVRGGVQRLHAPDRGGPHGGQLRRAAGGAGAPVPPGQRG